MANPVDYRIHTGKGAFHGTYTAYRLLRTSGQAVVTINGKDHYLGKHGTPASRQKYGRLISEWSSEDYSTAFAVSAPTTAMLMADYLDHCGKHYPTTANSETVMTRRALVFAEQYVDVLAKDFSPKKLKAVRERLLSHLREDGERLSRKYVNAQIGRIVRMFRWAAENDYVEIEVYLALKNVRGLQAGRLGSLVALHRACQVPRAKSTKRVTPPAGSNPANLQRLSPPQRSYFMQFQADFVPQTLGNDAKNGSLR